MTTNPRPTPSQSPSSDRPQSSSSLDHLASRLDTLGRARAGVPIAPPQTLLTAVQRRAAAHRTRRRLGALLLAAACLTIAAAVAINSARPHQTPLPPQPLLATGPHHGPDQPPPGSLAAMRSTISIGAITRANLGAAPDDLRLPMTPALGGGSDVVRVPRWPDAHRPDSAWPDPLRPR